MMLRALPNYWVFAGLLALSLAGTGGFSTAASAPSGSYASTTSNTHELAAQSRPRITVHPRQSYPGPYAKRYCQFWLAKEYRVSGPVITPQQRCWWQ
jgi:hypothetical protein